MQYIIPAEISREGSVVNHGLMGLLAGLLVVASAVPYCRSIIRDEEHANMVTWSLWALIGAAVLVTYWSAGARESMWTAVFGFTNPLLVVWLTLRQYRRNGKRAFAAGAPLSDKLRGVWKQLDRTDRTCLFIGLASLALWVWVRDDRSMAQYALYLALVADACAAIPTVRAHFAAPSEHVPLPWGMFAVASFLNIFAVSEVTFSNYVMPVYMCIGASFLTLPLIWYRVRHRIPLRQWY